MKYAVAILLAAGLWSAYAFGSGPNEAGENTLDPQSCRIAVIGEGDLPRLSLNPKAGVKQSEYSRALKKAYFSMGCFWGSEAMLAGCPGVKYTRVGFTGGQTPDPTYRAIADHVETVEVSYDPAEIRYSDLLDHFWSHHNARAKPIFRQYASAVFSADPAERTLAKERRAAHQARGTDDPILTAVLPLGTFYPADDSHQKYYLQQDAELLAQLPSGIDGLAATKLNALAGRGGERSALQADLAKLGVTESQAQALFARASWEAP